MQGLFPDLRCTSHAGCGGKMKLSVPPFASGDLAAQFAVSSWREEARISSVQVLSRF
jgi:hypothetical protein